ncbi:Hypp8505 [Branchiostoma lanceolatum]|uniref:Hypp8505 protein n=1 Tax=Branchiostoma lanceolatum TaxID=7740 RepID=A0A8J9Z761_BRALA|nr:Hypp8505 [Branchiostoma lanceolatum]
MLFYTESVLLVLVLGGSTAESLSEQTCLQYAEDGNCDFYTKCLEDKYSCGEKGYPVGYGHRYCTKFSTYYNDFNDEGKAWIDDVRKCLMKALVPIYKSNSYSCDEVKTLAFTSHPTCYTESGDRFCKVFWTNKQALWDVFEADDFLGEDSALAIEQILMTGLQCLCDYGAADEIHQVVDATSDVWTKVLDFTTQLWRDDPKEAIQADCEAKALQGDCDFYNCLERRHSCGLKGFASREGRPLCERLKKKKGLFNAQGQSWVTDFTKCLTRSLLPKYRDSSISCRHIHNFGYRAQDSCFIDTGVCDLVEDDQNEFALWYISDVVEDSRFQLELSTILCRCHKYEGGSRYKLKYSSEHGIHLKQKAPVVDQTSPADLPCTSQGGKCQDYSVRTCLAGYETNKCGGNALRRCCLQCDSSCESDHQTWSAGDSGCSNAGGQCKMDSNYCHGQYQTGLCGGPTGRKCCVPG